LIREKIAHKWNKTAYQVQNLTLKLQQISEAADFFRANQREKTPSIVIV